MFDAPVARRRDRYRCISLDWPGHGESGYAEGGFDFYDLARHAAELIERLGEGPAILAGLSQGGMIFMRMALERPELVRALILLDTSAGPEDQENLPAYEQLAAALRDGDDATREQVMDVVVTILYGPAWRERDPDGVAREKALMLGHDRQGGYLAARAVFDRDDITGKIGAINAPTLVICGEQDTSTPPERAQEIRDAIAGAELVMIPDSGHHSPIENPDAVSDAIEGFLARLPAPAEAA
jgi:pimeloyl-ACP methyl ester carboxylesterase